MYGQYPLNSNCACARKRTHLLGEALHLRLVVEQVELHCAQVRVVPILPGAHARAHEVESQVRVAFLQQELDAHVQHLGRLARLDERQRCATKHVRV